MNVYILINFPRASPFRDGCTCNIFLSSGPISDFLFFFNTQGFAVHALQLQPIITMRCSYALPVRLPGRDQ